ncbi:MAG TPA: Asp-tRNA(Asn)/Glu-tRNA(Gln) amidotransferase subunit GatB [Methanomassiliicoccales archaeon]|nr:Asp-tRNA(Asn)/Glu-tRNA(Gln) amidotransferase subunit GatB [Methanomassiliicoccales archaeon]
MKIGLEMHFQLPTRSKLFCSCPTSAADPNHNICPVCLGYPGSRPSLNRKALEVGLTIARFLDCRIEDRVWFSRKTYFYPDLVKNFQITQYESPLGTDGHFDLNGRRIGIWRVHLEEDPGRIKRVGRSGEEISFVDYNRSGIPLVEIVTAPDMQSPAEARVFIDQLIIELRSLCDLDAQDEQKVRVDANISVGEERVEIKNVQGLRNVERALKFEAVRQTKLLAAGKKVILETRRYDEERRVTMSARDKETEEDYGYIGEPDLGEFHIGQMAEELDLKETPLVRARRLVTDHGINDATAKQLVLTSSSLTDMFELLCRSVSSEKAVTWTMGPISSNWSALQDRHELWSDVVAAVKADSDGEITDNEAKRRILSLAGVKQENAEAGDADLDHMISDFIDAHPEVLADYRKNAKAANTVIGHVMKESRGRYSSKDVVEEVRKELEKRV